VNPLPAIDTVVPPEVGPRLGETLLITGAAACRLAPAVTTSAINSHAPARETQARFLAATDNVGVELMYRCMVILQ
jgi:hypothetical protein